MKGLIDYLHPHWGTHEQAPESNGQAGAGVVNYFYCFGGITFTLFIVQLLTGLLLSTHYNPSESEAYASIQRLDQTVPLGGLLRSVHKWAANLMVVMVLLHMIRVFVTGSYKNPRGTHLGRRRPVVRDDAGVWFYRLPPALGSEGVLGNGGGDQHARFGAVLRAAAHRLCTRRYGSNGPDAPPFLQHAHALVPGLVGALPLGSFPHHTETRDIGENVKR